MTPLPPAAFEPRCPQIPHLSEDEPSNCGLALGKVRRGHSKFHRSQFRHRKDRRRRRRASPRFAGRADRRDLLRNRGSGHRRACVRAHRGREGFARRHPAAARVRDRGLSRNQPADERNVGDRKAHEARLAELHKEFLRSASLLEKLRSCPTKSSPNWSRDRRARLIASGRNWRRSSCPRSTAAPRPPPRLRSTN